MYEADEIINIFVFANQTHEQKSYNKFFLLVKYLLHISNYLPCGRLIDLQNVYHELLLGNFISQKYLNISIRL